MTEKLSETRFVNSSCSSIPNLRRFAHEAMATTFEVLIIEQDDKYAAQAATAAFNEIDRLEKELSHFIENSDISRINSTPAMQPIVIGLEAFECLELAVKIYHETEGLFDITIGSLLKCWRDDNGNPRVPSERELEVARKVTGAHLIQLSREHHAVCLLDAPIYIDLGGIGKGYAVDCVAALLREWSIDSALIHGGYSSVLALDPPPDMAGWPLTFTHPQTQKLLAHLKLSNRAVSGSGVQKGGHIINPRTAKPTEARLAAWSSTPDAATGDALSTTFMMMTAEQIEKFCTEHPDVMAAVIPMQSESKSSESPLIRYGQWDDIAEFE